MECVLRILLADNTTGSIREYNTFKREQKIHIPMAQRRLMIAHSLKRSGAIDMVDCSF